MCLSSSPTTMVFLRSIIRSIAIAVCLCLKVTGETQKDYDVRLVGGGRPSEGRVEVFHDHEWGSVCDDYWSFNAAQVVCRQLGYNPPMAAPGSAYFGEGIGPITLDNVVCSGEEESLIECQHSLRDHNCRHSEDAGVVCGVEPHDFDVRLVDGGNHFEGRVEVYYRGLWGTVCDSTWNNEAASVVCRQLGLPNVLVRGPGRAFFGHGSGMIVFDDIVCTGEETELADCVYSNPGGNQNQCDHYMDASVICGEHIEVVDEDANFNVRLDGGDKSNMGRVEVLINGVWGTICDEGWDRNDANVVCMQLGFVGALQAVGGAHFGEGTGPILLHNVECYGKERNLSNCMVSHYFGMGCSHEEDAGVICQFRTVFNPGFDPYFVRLVNGPFPNQGRVEVQYSEHKWGTICDDEWDLNDADVICRQLGYGNAVYALQGAHFGQGAGPIVLDNVRCTGSELNLAECGYDDDIDCEHTEDAAVICYSKEFPMSRYPDQYKKGSNTTTRNIVIIVLVTIYLFLFIVFCVVRHMRKQQQREVMATGGRLPPRPSAMGRRRPPAVPNNYMLVNNGPIAIENGWATANLSTSSTDRSPSPDLLPSSANIVANPTANLHLHERRNTPRGNPTENHRKPPDFSPPPSYSESDYDTVAYDKTEETVRMEPVT